MAAKKKPAKKKSPRAKKPEKKRGKKPAQAVRRPAKPARKPAKPVKAVKAVKAVKQAARKAAVVKPRPPAKKSVVEKKAALRAVVKPPKPAPTLKIVPAARATGKSPALKFQQPSPTPRDKPRVPVINKDYMSPRQIEVFRKLLLDWKRSLMEEVDRTVHHMQDEASNFPDPNDRATQEEEFALELRTRDRERKLIKKIDEALTSLDGGDYGYCEICGVEIGIKRLEARPTATLCIDCKNLEEIKERQYG